MLIKRFLSSSLFVASLGFLMLASSNVGAATLNLVGGQLLGASDVIVDGVSYDVEFVDGTCVDLFDGCDSASDFIFGTPSAGSLASQALLDQVFLDGGSGSFDSNPELTNGCSSPLRCSVATPIVYVGPDFALVYAVNESDEMFDEVGPVEGFPPGNDVSTLSAATFAVWSLASPPAVPSIGPLGLATLAFLLGAANFFFRPALAHEPYRKSEALPRSRRSIRPNRPHSRHELKSPA